MAIKKIALMDGLLGSDSIIPIEKVASNDVVAARFRKVADQLREEQAKLKIGRQLSPKVDDFLYCHAIMMHAAEAALINQDTGEPLLNKEGKPVHGEFVSFKDAKGHDSVRWESKDGILPYRNQNSDIFPEEDLIKAHKDWVGKPLCRDHVSNSVDGIRGIIVDTYYDSKYKRVHALFALDKKNYGDLARKVEAGYATAVSMGTAVGRSICTECSNVATVESEYCHHVKSRQCHGEVNKDLSPIELSIVVTGADPKAHILTVIAALKQYEDTVKSVESGDQDASVLKDVYAGLDNLNNKVANSYELVVDDIKNSLATLPRDLSGEAKNKMREAILAKLNESGISLEQLPVETKRELLQSAVSRGIELVDDDEALALAIERLNLRKDEMDVGPSQVERETLPAKNDLGTDSEGYKPISDPLPQFGFGATPPQTFASVDAQYVDADNLANKIASLKSQILELENKLNRENIMTFEDLKKKRIERKAYWQGTEEPTPGKVQYPLMGDQDKIREKDDKQMLQDGSMGGDDGMVPGDEQKKKLVQRADLSERMAKRAKMLAEYQEKLAKVKVVKNKAGQEIAIDTQSGQQLADDGKAGKKGKKKEGDEEDEDLKEKEDKKSKNDKDSDKDKKDSKKDSKKEEKDSKKDKASDKDEDEDKDAKKGKKEKKAYWQGTEEPQRYPLMGDQDKIREKDDRQMLQDGSLGGDDGMVPGDEQKKRDMQRMASLKARLFKGAEPASSRWEFVSGGKKLFSLSAKEAYGEYLNDKFGQNTTFSDVFHSKEYGTRVMKMLRTSGLEATARELGVNLTKVAEDPAALPAPAPEAAPETPEAALEPVDPVAEPVEEKEDSRLDDLAPLITQLEELATRFVEVAGTKATPEEEGLGDVDVAIGEPPVVEAPAEVMPGAVASVSADDLLKAYAYISDATNELCFIESKASEGEQSEGFYSVAAQAIHDAKLVLEEGKSIVSKYAKSKKALRKKAMEPGWTEMKADDGEMSHYVLDKEELAQVEEVAADVMSDHESDPAMHSHDEAKEEEMLELVEEKLEDLPLEEDLCGDDKMMAMDMDYDTMDAVARKQYRENLVKEAMKYDPLYEAERKGGGHKLEDLGLKVSDDGDKVETLDEVQDKMLDVATKPLKKVCEAAAKLDKWIKAGGINSAKLDVLVAEGAVDGDVVKYWKEYFNEAEGGKEFANELVSEFTKSKSKTAALEDAEAREVRVRRAYHLGIEAQKKGLIGSAQADLDKYVDTLKAVPEEHFNALKNHVAMYKSPRQLVSAPLVGLTDHEGGVQKEASVNSDISVVSLSKLFD